MGNSVTSEGMFVRGVGRHKVAGGLGEDTLRLDWRSLNLGVSGSVSNLTGLGYDGQFSWRDDLGPLDFGGRWKEISAEAAFSPRDTGDPFQFGGALWLSNGYHIGGGLSRDLWRSDDGGANWTLVNSETPYDAYSRIEVLGDYMYAIRDTVWRSQDGLTWEQVAERTPFEAAQGLFEMRATVFNDRLWVIAPTAAWSSEDGATWTKEAYLPFDARFNFALTVFDGKLVLAGGFSPYPNDPPESGYPNFTSYNDVWTSVDGRTWEAATPSAQWSARQWLHMEEVDGLLYMFGGYSNRDARNLNDMWVSKDGVNWTEVRLHEVWSGRHWSSVYVVDDQIVLAGGNDSVPGFSRLRNDVWTYSDDGQLSSASFTGIDRFELLLGDGPNDIQLGAGADLLVGGLSDDILRGGAGDDDVSGGEGADQLFGEDGDDRLDGGVGADAMAGGAGDDVYVLDDLADTVLEGAGEGTDEVRTALSRFSIAAWEHVERLTGTSDEGQELTGNSASNVISGGAGDDLLDGGGRADNMAGGNGDDIYVVDDAGDTVTEEADGGSDEIRTRLSSFSIATMSHVETLTGTAATGQTLTGNDLANTIDAGIGSDLLDGGAGADVMSGGEGDDVYIVDDFADLVIEESEGGRDEIRTSFASYSLAAMAHMENLTGLADTAQLLIGNSGINVITAGIGNDRLEGGLGDDLLDGGAGRDIMAGGAGDDVYLVDHGGDTIVEASGEGDDEIRTTLASYSLADLPEIERLTGILAGDQALTGNAASNIIRGGSGGDTLDGGEGADRLIGGFGADRLIGGGEGEDRFKAPNLWLQEENGVEAWYSADFDGDGRDDLFRYVPSVSGADMFLSSGTGFESAGSWTLAGHGPGRWFIGDFNGDSRADIFRYLPKQSGAEVFLSTGSGFALSGSWTAAGFGTQSWSVGDFDGDGRDDLMRYAASDGTTQVLLSTGNAFARPQTWAVAGSGTAGWLIGDFNRDGRDDLLRRTSDGDAEVVLSNGAGFDAPQSWVRSAAPGQWRIGDVNRDGMDDVLLLSNEGVQAMLSTGSAFRAAFELTKESSGADNWYLGDFNGDGGADLLRQGGSGAVETLLAGLPSNDVFEVEIGFGHDVIEDFSKTDMIRFAPELFDSFEQVRAAAQSVAGGVLISIDQENTVLLSGIELASLTADHFAFG